MRKLSSSGSTFSQAPVRFRLAIFSGVSLKVVTLLVHATLCSCVEHVFASVVLVWVYCAVLSCESGLFVLPISALISHFPSVTALVIDKCTISPLYFQHVLKMHMQL